MSSLAEIEKLTGDYAVSSQELTNLVLELRNKLDEVKRFYLERLRPLADRTAQDRALLSAAIQEDPELFRKPRTYVFHGIKVGYQKKKGSLVIANEEATIRLIRKLFPEESDALIAVSESVIKNALNNLTADALKKIGVSVEKDSDEVLIKSTATEVEKFVSKLIAETAEKHEAELMAS